MAYSKTYTVHGEPTLVLKSRTTDSFDRIQMYRDSLKDQHQRSPIEGPFTLDVLFYFAIPPTFTYPHQKRLATESKPRHIAPPNVHNLFDFVYTIARGILFNDKKRSTNIVSITGEKLYCKDFPRTEITLRVL